MLGVPEYGVEAWVTDVLYSNKDNFESILKLNTDRKNIEPAPIFWPKMMKNKGDKNDNMLQPSE